MSSPPLVSNLRGEIDALRNASSPWLRQLKIAAIILLVLLGADLTLDIVKWPFRKNATIASLEKLSGCDVTISRFEKHFLPHPGYVAEAVIFTRNGTTGPVTLATIGRFHCEGSWFAILTFTHRISRIDLDGARFIIPQQIPPPRHKKSNAALPTTVTDLFAPSAILEVDRESAKSLFHFPQLHLSNLAKDKPVTFRIRMINPHLIGTADMAGSVGPLQLNDVKETKLTGAFTLSNLDLSAHQEIAGTVSASGRFEGELKNVKVQGRVAIPDFEVKHSNHRQGLTAEYRAVVDGTHGDISIDSAAVHILSSTLLARGSIRGRGDKTIALDIDGLDAAIQDLLRLFGKSDPAPMAGSLTMHAHVIVEPGRETFLERVRMSGDFKIWNGVFASRKTEEKISYLSARASGRKNKNVRAVTVQMSSRVELRHEMATLSEGFFALPGAVARGGGSYSLRDQAINLHGKLAMHASLSKAATGIKSILAIPLDPFFKKHGAGAVIPVRMTGTYSHPKFKLSL